MKTATRMTPAEARRAMGAVVGRAYSTAPDGGGCYACARDALAALGVDLPANYGGCIGRFAPLGWPPREALRPGDMFLFEHKDDEARAHVAVAMGDGRVLHADRGEGVVDHLPRLLDQWAVRDVGRPKEIA